MQRVFILLYGFTAYALFLFCVVATIGFIGGLYGKTIDSGPAASPWLAALVDVALITAFGLHHSLAARAGFKAQLTRVVPPAAERSTYVLVASLLLLFLIWQWRPIDGIVWHLEGTMSRALVYAVYAGGWGLVLISTFLIDHWELFGISQALRRWRNQPAPEPVFRLPLPGSFIRVSRRLVWFAPPVFRVGSG